MCTKTAGVSSSTSHVTTKQHCKYTTSVDIQKNMLCKATVTYSESHTTRAQCVRWEAENSAIIITAIVKRLGLTSDYDQALDKSSYQVKNISIMTGKTGCSEKSPTLRYLFSLTRHSHPERTKTATLILKQAYHK